MNPPIIVLVDGTSWIPKNGSQTQNTPPKTSVKDNNVRSAAGRRFDPIVNNIKPIQTKKPCKADNDEFFKLITKLFSNKNKANKENKKQNNPPKATVVNFGVSFFHFSETENIAKPKDYNRPQTIPNKSLKFVLL